jgi:exodeoxyribonuclease VII large subunit
LRIGYSPLTLQFSILSVSQLNRQVKSYLENELGTLHVEGEVSNLTKPSSGHFYFTLKDSSAQIRCVYFRNRHQKSIKTPLCDGQKVVASGQLSLYEARGDYQLIVDSLTEAGLGELYQRFEELKIKLAAEGLFHVARKKCLPPIPQSIGIITSPSGAAIRDILSTLARRFPLAKIYIYPSEVQGSTAPQQLIKALRSANTDKRCDVLILARGGGSIEDLWAFNNEQLAYEIAASTIPIATGIGHETDFTIADFVADYRAETPTAAAVAVTPYFVELLKALHHTICKLHNAVLHVLDSYKIKLKHLMQQISSPRHAILNFWQKLDYLERQLLSNSSRFISHKKHQIHIYLTQLDAQNPRTKINYTQWRINQLLEQLLQLMLIKVTHLKYQMTNNLFTLNAVSPLATLDRGYAIVTKEDKIVITTEQVHQGDEIKIRLAKGNLICEVIQVN